MAEYIEREAAIDAVKQNVPYAYHAVAITLASMIPAADVKPIVRGEWKPSAMIMSGTGSVWRTHGVACSVCNSFYLEETNYCPNCGANMRGDNDDA